jgi:hypothetical protein
VRDKDFTIATIVGRAAEEAEATPAAAAAPAAGETKKD